MERRSIMKSIIIKLVSVALQTYITWCVILIGLNIEFWWFAIYPLGLFPIFMHFIKFIFPVSILAVLLTIIFHVFALKKHGFSSRWYFPFVINFTFLTLFFITGEIYKDTLILAEGSDKNAECLHLHSFLTSFHRAGEFSPEHAYIIVGEKVFFWSYSELTFVPDNNNNPRSCGEHTYSLRPIW